MLARALILWLLSATAAAADPVSIGALVISGAAAVGAANAAAIGAYLGVSATLAGAGVFAAATLASFGLQAAFGSRPRAPRPPDLIRELARAQSLTPKRFVYGRFKAYGSPAPFISVRSPQARG